MDRLQQLALGERMEPGRLGATVLWRVEALFCASRQGRGAVLLLIHYELVAHLHTEVSLTIATVVLHVGFAVLNCSQASKSSSHTCFWY